MEKHPITRFMEALARPAVIDETAMFDRMKRASDYIGALSRVFFLITLIALVYYKVDPAKFNLQYQVISPHIAKYITLVFLTVVLIVLVVPFWVYTSVMIAKVILPSKEFMLASRVPLLVYRYVFQAILLVISLGLMIVIIGVVKTVDFSHL